MTESMIPKQKGDTYQALVFWEHLLELRINDFFELVCLECIEHGASFVEDVVIKYSKPIVEKSTGLKVEKDYIQCKYNMTLGQSYTVDNLLDPKFISSKKESMLERLYKSYCELKKNKHSFRLIVQSSRIWHPDDKMASYIHEERIRDTFYEVNKPSNIVKIREKFKTHLGNISDDELKEFLSRVRFRLGKNTNDILNILKIKIREANLQPISETTSTIVYDDIAWKWFQLFKRHFDLNKLIQILEEEDLILPKNTEHSEVSIWGSDSVAATNCNKIRFL